MNLHYERTIRFSTDFVWISGRNLEKPKRLFFGERPFQKAGRDFDGLAFLGVDVRCPGGLIGAFAGSGSGRVFRARMREAVISMALLRTGVRGLALGVGPAAVGLRGLRARGVAGTARFG